MVATSSKRPRGACRSHISQPEVATITSVEAAAAFVMMDPAGGCHSSSSRRLEASMHRMERRVTWGRETSARLNDKQGRTV